MSEKIYAVLFRLFPARFRAMWQNDALELLRDRARDERGLIPRLRLWYDLLGDFAVSLPRTYLNDNADLAASPAKASDSIPSFTILEDKPIRSSAFFYGTLLSVLVLIGLSMLARHGGRLPILKASSAAEASGVTMDPWATGASGGNGSGDTAMLGNGPASVQPASVSAGNPARLLGRRGGPHLVFFDAAERHRVIEGVVVNLTQHYPDAMLARQLGRALQARERSGDYDAIGDPRAFATVLTRQLRNGSGDSHFEVMYSQIPLRDFTPRSDEEVANYVTIMRQAGCTFETVTVLPGNIGYLKLDAFPDPEACGDMAIAAMKKLGGADALIIDLRDNSGGSPAMALFLAGWLFDRPAFFWNPRESDSNRMGTHSPMAGSRLADKPVWLLTSSRTYSAAEQFSYNLKMLHRATLVGETTAGATDVGIFHRIDEHFGIGLRESSVRNPYSQPDWAGRGVEPDIRVPSDKALDIAQSLAADRMHRR